MDGEGRQQQGEGRVAGDAEGQSGHQCPAGHGVVRGFGGDEAVWFTLAEIRSVFRAALGRRVTDEGRRRRPRPRQDADQDAYAARAEQPYEAPFPFREERKDDGAAVDGHRFDGGAFLVNPVKDLGQREDAHHQRQHVDAGFHTPVPEREPHHAADRLIAHGCQQKPEDTHHEPFELVPLRECGDAG